MVLALFHLGEVPHLPASFHEAVQSSHRLFSIYDILENIVNFGFGIDDLINLACVSRAFSDLALDAIWYEKKSLAPIISLLPGDACGVDDSGDGEIWTVRTHFASLVWLVFDRKDPFRLPIAHYALRTSPFSENTHTASRS